MSGLESWLPGAALLFGLMGGTHCAAMCGGIAGALGRAERAREHPLQSALLYSTGRISSYGVAGMLAGWLGFTASEWIGGDTSIALRIALGVLMVVVGVSIAGGSAVTARLEAIGRPLWRRISPLVGRLGPADRPWKLVALGALWGWLPCGLVYAALAAATATASVWQGMAFMLCFGLGTLPWLVAAGVLTDGVGRLVARVELRRAMGLLVVCYGLWTLLGPLAMSGGAPGHAGHAGH